MFLPKFAFYSPAPGSGTVGGELPLVVITSSVSTSTTSVVGV